MAGASVVVVSTTGTVVAGVVTPILVLSTALVVVAVDAKI